MPAPGVGGIANMDSPQPADRLLLADAEGKTDALSDSLTLTHHLDMLTVPVQTAWLAGAPVGLA
jgi:hypothetical protein